VAQPLPIDAILGEIIAALRKGASLVIEAPPGAGKTTRVPRALLDAGFTGEIVVLEPRRLAARAAARRVADELGEALGNRVGYEVRFDEVASKATRIRFVTEGILTRKLLSNPTLSGVGVVLLDEFHERHLQGDLALALLRRLQATARPDLKLVVMSATLDAEEVGRFLGAPSIKSSGKSYEVEVLYREPDDRALGLVVASGVREAAHRTQALSGGHILVFLPGAAEIRASAAACEAVARDCDLEILPLHGDMPPEEQDRVFSSRGKRKLILATNVAESSLTIEGVSAVVDTGLVRVATSHPWSSLPTLRTERCSRASLEQRKGRAGRTGPGIAVRLYSERDFTSRPAFDAPEISRTDLASTRLELASMNINNLDWFTAPPPDAWDGARALLTRIGALDDSESISQVGRLMLKTGLHPRAARVFVAACELGAGIDAPLLGAVLSERDPRLEARASFRDGKKDRDLALEDSDVIALMDRLDQLSPGRINAQAARSAGLDFNTVKSIDRIRQKLEAQSRSIPATRENSKNAIAEAILTGFCDRVCRRLRHGSPNLAVAGGGAAELSRDSAVRHAEWLCAVEAEARPNRAMLVRAASAIDPLWLLDAFSDRIEERTEVQFHEDKQVVEAVDLLLYEGLPLSRGPSIKPDGQAIARCLVLRAEAVGGLRHFAGDEWETFAARWTFASGVSSEVPPLAEQELAALFISLAESCRSFAELKNACTFEAICNHIGYPFVKTINSFAPERVQVSLGSTAAVHYEVGKAPYVATYLQDFFGLTKTPTIAKGRVPVQLHLWAPNRRAVQVTTDLDGFWTRHYPAIRKELMRKYPRHTWPEDPRVPMPRMKRDVKK
jgi:ATP-dependent helicase HrpB